MNCDGTFNAGIYYVTDAYKTVCRFNEELHADLEKCRSENAKLLEQIETLVMYVESDGTRYWVDDDGNQHFDHSAVKDDASKLQLKEGE